MVRNSREFDMEWSFHQNMLVVDTNFDGLSLERFLAWGSPRKSPRPVSSEVVIVVSSETQMRIIPNRKWRWRAIQPGTLLDNLNFHENSFFRFGRVHCMWASEKSKAEKPSRQHHKHCENLG